MKEPFAGKFFVPEHGGSHDGGVARFYYMLNLVHKQVIDFLRQPKHYHRFLGLDTCQAIDLLTDIQDGLHLPDSVRSEINFLNSINLVYDPRRPSRMRRIALLESWPDAEGQSETVEPEILGEWYSMWLDEFDHSSIQWAGSRLKDHEPRNRQRMRARAHRTWTAIMLVRVSDVTVADHDLVERIIKSGLESIFDRRHAERQIDSLLRGDRIDIPSRLSLDERDAKGNYEDYWMTTRAR